MESYLQNHPDAPEYQFLLACCRNALGSGEDPLTCPPDINQKKFIQLLRYHKLVPHLYPVVRKCSNIPDELLNTLQDTLRQHHFHTLRLSGELVRISELFSRHGIPWISVKGPVLSIQLYNDITARQSNDLDILVEDAYQEAAEKVLAEAGYFRLSAPDWNKQQIKHVKTYASDRSFMNKEKNIHLELHWKLTASNRIPPSNNDWFSSIGYVPISGQNIPTLNQEMHLLYLCIHGYHHVWFRLFWLWDIAYYLRFRDGNRIVDLAYRFGVEQAISDAANLSFRLFHVPLPTGLKDKANEGNMKFALQYILNTDKTLTLKNMRKVLLYKMRLSPRFEHKWSLLAIRLSNPRDWEMIRLPGVLFPLYYILKPLVFVARKMRK